MIGFQHCQHVCHMHACTAENYEKFKLKMADQSLSEGANSKHWFTTSFLQPLPYLVMPWGSRKLSANEQFLVGAQTVVSLLQTTEIKQGVSFIATTKFMPVQIKPKSFESRRNSFSLPRVDASRVYMGSWALGRFYRLSTQTFRRVLTASVDSCGEIKSTPSVA